MLTKQNSRQLLTSRHRRGNGEPQKRHRATAEMKRRGLAPLCRERRRSRTHGNAFRYFAGKAP